MILLLLLLHPVALKRTILIGTRYYLSQLGLVPSQQLLLHPKMTTMMMVLWVNKLYYRPNSSEREDHLTDWDEEDEEALGICPHRQRLPILITGSAATEYEDKRTMTKIKLNPQVSVCFPFLRFSRSQTLSCATSLSKWEPTCRLLLRSLPSANCICVCPRVQCEYSWAIITSWIVCPVLCQFYGSTSILWPCLLLFVAAAAAPDAVNRMWIY